MIARLSKIARSAAGRMFSSNPSDTNELDQEEVDFVKRDFEEMKRMELRLQYDSAYLKIMDKWQKPLEKKRQRRARMDEIKQNFVG